MTDRWTDAKDYEGDSWNDVLQDHTKYAKRWEKDSGCQARKNAQYWRDKRWQVLGELQRGER